MRSQFNIITSILLVFITFWASAQKVGVVLSGGGPKGVTHVGVLKALEDNNIPIDFITGTSMGAIIGGMYASGYSPEEIEQMIQSEELVSWLSTVMDPQYSYFFKQSPPNASWQLFKITYERELQTKLPSTIISPYKLDLGFLQLYSGASAAAGYDFDSLYIPFRCVASDIEANKQVVIDKGRLEKAIRASMSFPFYFKPVEINGRLMFDGGMYNNFPADVMTDSFNPDIIIGSKAASNYGPPDEDDIISQIQSMLMANTQYEISPDSGILIVPQLWSVNVTDFSNTSSFIDSGYISTIRQIDRIKEFVKRTESKDQKTIKRNKFRESIPPLQIKDVIIEGVPETRKVYLSRLIKKDKFLLEVEEGKISPGETYEEIKRHYYAILSDEKVESVYPELTYDQADTGYNLQFNVTPNQRLEAEIGGLISSQAINEIFLQFEYNIWGRTALSLTGNAYFGRFHNSGLFRAHYDIPSRLPLSFSLGYTLNGWNYFRTKTYFFADENPSFLIQRESFWDFDIATPVTRTSRMMAQLQWGLIRDEYYQDNQFTRLDTADLTYFDFYSPGLIYELNTLNRKQFPSEGALLKICGRFISGLEENEPGSTSVDTTHISIYHNWLQVRLIFDNYFNLSKKFDMGLYGQIALSDKQEFNNYVSTVLAAPAFEPLPESQAIFLPQFRAHSFFSIGIKTIFHPIRNLDFRAEAYLFQPYREILKTEDNKTAFGDPLAKQYYIFSSRFVYYAPFGPISVSLNYYESLEEPFVFNLHIGYYIFNKKPFR